MNVVQPAVVQRAGEDDVEIAELGAHRTVEDAHRGGLASATLGELKLRAIGDGGHAHPSMLARRDAGRARYHRRHTSGSLDRRGLASRRATA